MGIQPILLFGGDSRERLVSVATAQNLACHLKSPVCWFWAFEGPVFEVQSDSLINHKDPFTVPFSPAIDKSWPDLEEALKAVKNNQVLVNALHGGMGEDGTAQHWMEDRWVPFTGSCATACETAWNKVRAKKLMSKEGFLVAPSVTIQRASRARTEKLIREFYNAHKKILIKPVGEGSSFDLHPIFTEEAIESAVNLLMKNPEQRYLLEKWIDGIELTVGVIERPGRTEALPCTEIRVNDDRIFDYEGKYLGHGTQEVTPADISNEISTLAKALALGAHTVLGCGGYSRTDIVFGQNGPVFLETNTLPGLSGASLVPQQLDAAQISIDAFLNEQIDYALRRYSPRSSSQPGSQAC